MGVQERKARERQRRTNEIREAAHRVFENKGFLNTTLQDVAQEAEVSVGLIYRYFKSKEDIFAALSLKGAEVFDSQVEEILGRSTERPAKEVLAEIARAFFDFYGPYGEYFDLLMYSYRGLKKEVQIRGTTLTRLMSLTLRTLDRIKEYIQHSDDFSADDEEDALQMVFLLWATLLGCHKLFDSSGRGHLFAFDPEEFVDQIVLRMMNGLSAPSSLAESPSEERQSPTP